LITTHWTQSAAAAKAYYRQSDYYATCPGEWLGEGANSLGLTGPARAEDFDLLADNINPLTGESLTTYTRDGRRVGLDMTFNATKSVSIARELAGTDWKGDPHVEEAHREAVAYTVGVIEDEMQARVRADGRMENRTTGNIVAYRVTHRDTRINADDQMPDPNLHDHVFFFNATWDEAEGKWKAAELGQIKHDLPFYEAAYHNRLAANLKELGYGIEKKGKSFEIAGVGEELTKKFSRRTAYIEKVADKLGIENPKTKAKLGATTRLGKAKETADDLNGYYASRLTPEEKERLADLQGWAGYEGDTRKAVEFAISHLFERRSVVDEKRVYETAIRHGIGSVTPEGIQEEAKRQGLLVKDGEATTRQVLAEEGRVIGFARDGRGTCGRLGNEKGRPDESKRPTQSELSTSESLIHQPTGETHTATASPLAQPISDLSPEQAAIARHVWDSPDRVILIRGAAGTGKTHTMKATIEGIDRPVVVLAPSAEASRGVLRKEGFAEADTVARFLIDEKFQETVKNGVIWVDEAGLLGIRQVREVFDAAERLNARVVLQGDKKQHGSVERGATLRVLEEFAGLPVAELKDIRRQKGRYKAAVASLAKGDMLGGYDQLDGLGWVRETRSNTPLVDDYLAALDARKSVLVVAPTHAEGNEITAEIRGRLKERGNIGKEGHEVVTLVPLGWTEAERGDLERYEGTEVMVFHRNSGTFKAGQTVRVADWKPGDRFAKASHFSVHVPASIELAKGDVIRVTANGKTKDEKHKLNNGATYRVKGFTKDDDIVLDNGWVVGKDFGHITHGYVTTSHASQGKTVDRVLIAMGSESRPAISAEQFYVSVSRGRDQATVYSDMTPAELREAIQKADSRKSATELLGAVRAKARPKNRLRMLADKTRAAFRQLREKATDAISVQRQKERDYAHAR
jgi:conjugative relaxase-like TrwC/TraI family protein